MQARERKKKKEKNKLQGMTLTMGRENLPKNGTSSNAPGRELCV